MKKYDKVVAADGAVTVLNTEKEFLAHCAELKDAVHVGDYKVDDKPDIMAETRKMLR